MRLTLRTLLAHMDDVLEPNDRAEVGQKIEESEFAKTLMQRIRDVTSRLRLGTPKILGKGLAADSNTVAEYLDHTMHNDRVQEFEKICLESDVHLAEVASCHQVLALVLGHPAEIDPAMRRRMYDVINRPDEPLDEEHPPLAAVAVNGSPTTASAAPIATAVAAPVATAATTVPAPVERERPHVPDYLRSDSKKLPLLWIVAAGILLLLGIARIMGPFDKTHPIAAMFGSKPDPAPVANNTSGNDPVGSSAVVNTVPANSTQANSTQPNTAAANTAPAKLGPVETSPAPVAVPDTAVNKSSPELPNVGVNNNPIAANPATTLPAVPAAIPSTVEPINPATNTLPPTNSIATTPAPAVVATNPATGNPVLETPGANPAAPAVAMNQPTNPVSVEGAGPVVTPVPMNPVASPANPDVATPLPPQPMPTVGPLNAETPAAAAGIAGRMTQDGTQVLLSWRTPPGGEGAWVRVNGTETIAAGERLLGLHTYRPAITLKNGLSLQLIGETQLEVFSTAKDDIPLIRLHFGRIVVANSGRANTQFAIEPGVKQSGLVTLNDPDSLVAIEVARFLPVGSNPETVQSQVSANLYIASGRAQWQPDVTVPAGNPLAGPLLVKLLTRPDSLQPPETKLPTWIVKNELSGFDTQASGPFSQLLMGKPSVGLALREIANTNRRAELRYLASRSLALIDDFEFFIDSFNDTDQRGVWNKEIETLQQALARGPETAKLVRDAFVKQRPAYGEKLYRCLWGATPADLATGLSDDLLAGLESDNLDLRILSYDCLRSAVADPRTGIAPTQNYSPESTNTAARQQAVQRWKQYVREFVRKAPPAVETGPAEIPMSLK
jgi:hypothetical protein